MINWLIKLSFEKNSNLNLGNSSCERNYEIIPQDKSLQIWNHVTSQHAQPLCMTKAAYMLEKTLICKICFEGVEILIKQEYSFHQALFSKFLHFTAYSLVFADSIHANLVFYCIGHDLMSINCVLSCLTYETERQRLIQFCLDCFNP